MIDKYKSVSLSFGYVESNTTAVLIYTATKKIPSSRSEALESLTEHLYKKYLCDKKDNDDYVHTYKTHMAKCCQKAWKNSNRDLNTCPKCGANYNAEIVSEFDISDWQNYLRDLMNSDCDSYGYHYECSDFEDEYGWSPWQHNFNHQSDEMVIVAEKAEDILTIALAKIHPELKSAAINDEDGFFDLDNDNVCGSYIYKDYDSICDGTNSVYNNLDPDIKTVRTTIRYKSGTVVEKENGKIQSIRYVNGDQIYYNDDMKPVRVVHRSGDMFVDFNPNPFGESNAKGGGGDQ
ncbi:hypothetical protein UFOVP1290_269 [uncultured Caudovirales phage]|uniref:Uncharacterized protein n=1 Tax=uncultured Caudovirales phage TaxID=2100421 RepID=A0A6J5RIA0_9CAUD|nr:hypothetical protein UFOVP1290_269 [uncultured Caudovirales phage]